MFYLFFLLIIIFLNISFLTIFERYLIGLSQNRLGPNKNSFLGFLQAIFDGIKLLKKENLFVMKMNYNLYFFSFLLIFFSFFFWFFIDFFGFIFLMFNKSLLFIIILSFLVFLNLLIGIFQKSKYSFIGSMRFSNQSLSLEILVFLLIFLILILNKNSNFNFSFNFDFLIILIYIFIIFLIDMNRVPFDFSEGESELVSGWNTELMSFIFVLIFLSEYNMILFFSMFLSFLINFNFSFMFFVFLIIFLRCVFPRFRYDLMMSFMWFNMLVLFFGFILFFYTI